MQNEEKYTHNAHAHFINQINWEYSNVELNILSALDSLNSHIIIMLLMLPLLLLLSPKATEKN